jgi:hypothetical protein
MKNRRSLIDRPLDWIRFKLDSFPADYQPLPWQDARADAGRAKGTLSRWDAMEPILSEESPLTALDVGANVGWFTFALAKRGVRTIAIERHPRHYRTILYLISRLQEDKVSLFVTSLDPQSVSSLPTADCVLFLAVWHHLVREHGFDAATAILKELWAHTNKMLFFETGENELASTFGLPDMGDDSQQWLDNYLAEVCEGGRVEFLGMHQVPEVCGGTSNRHLFTVRR